MNAKDRDRLNVIADTADRLLNNGVTGSGITNIEVLEATLGDIHAVKHNREPLELKALLKRDEDHMAGGSKPEFAPRDVPTGRIFTQF